MRGERYMSNARTRPSTTKKGASKERGYQRAKGEAWRTGQAEGAFHRVWESIHIVLIISMEFLKQGSYMTLSSHEKMGTQWIPPD